MTEKYISDDRSDIPKYKLEIRYWEHLQFAYVQTRIQNSQQKQLTPKNILLCIVTYYRHKLGHCCVQVHFPIVLCFANDIAVSQASDYRKIFGKKRQGVFLCSI